jgi:hypothetical protein
MKPVMKGAAGTPIVTINVHAPMHLARSFLKKVSATTALPIAAAGLIKKAVMARQRAIVAYEGLFAQPIFPTKLQINEIKKIGRRPNRLDSGRQNKGAPPSTAMNSDTK